MMQRARPLFAFFLLALGLHAQGFLAGTPEIVQSLDRLRVLGSVLMIAAHPDDENTAVLAYFARGRHMRTGYLSITRGEGGQNRIGPERGPLLGVLRTQELLAARHIDGAEQFFTRAIDFGYSKTAEETLATWGREETLRDIVWVIRSFRPDVIILRFSGTARDGHGHHQSSAMLGREAFHAAADRSRFPDQLSQVDAWRAKRVVFNQFAFTPEMERASLSAPNRVEIDAGLFDPVLGRSYAELAGISRSMHKSQGFGAAQRRGPVRASFTHVDGDPAGMDLFDGVATGWDRLQAPHVGRLLDEAREAFDPRRPESTIPRLMAARRAISEIHHPWAKWKLSELDEAIALCSGLWVDATADRWSATPGSSVHITLTALNRSSHPFEAARFNVTGWGQILSVSTEPLESNRPWTGNLKFAVPSGQPPSQPHWLAGTGFPTVPGILPELTATLEAGGIRLERPVVYRYVDAVEGERTRPLIVVPPVTVQAPETALMFPQAGARRVAVRAASNAGAVSGELALRVPSGWAVEPSSHEIRLGRTGEQRDFVFMVKPPDRSERTSVRAVATVGGTEIASGMQVIAYPHIPAHAVFPESSQDAVRADVKVAVRRVGYVSGPGDDIPQALAQLGLDVTLLSAEDLRVRDLSEFEAVVTGPRAYSVRADLAAAQPRLMEYVHSGGTLVVQYSERPPVSLGPYPIAIFTNSAAGRVSVENAPVTVLKADHPLLNFPNRIASEDFDGWVQERGLYFAESWDSRYQTVLQTHDPGQPPLAGGLLYTPFGKGAYVFTAFAWFRQLPAGVPGAYRLFANLLSAGAVR